MDRNSIFTWRAWRLRTRYQPKSRLGRGLVSAAPWLNVILLIFMFVFLNSRFVLQPGVIVHLPEAPFSDGRPYGLRLAILSQESPEPSVREEIIFYDDERFLVRDTAQMEDLKIRFVKSVREKPRVPLIIEADRLVLQGTVIDVFNMAADAGIREINIATRPAR